MSLALYCAVALGGAVGAVLRTLLSRLLNKRLPGGTWLANVLGSFLLGLLLAVNLDQAWLLAFLVTGFCGAFTTWSTFVLEVWALLEVRAIKDAGAYTTITLLGAFAATTLGLSIGANLG